ASRALRNAEKAKRSKTQQSRASRTTWRVVQLMLWAFCLFAVIVVVRGINWSGVLRGINTTKTGIDREAAKPGKPNRTIPDPVRRKPQNESKAKPKSSADT